MLPTNIDLSGQPDDARGVGGPCRVEENEGVVTDPPASSSSRVPAKEEAVALGKQEVEGEGSSGHPTPLAEPARAESGVFESTPKASSASARSSDVVPQPPPPAIPVFETTELHRRMIAEASSVGGSDLSVKPEQEDMVGAAPRASEEGEAVEEPRAREEDKAVSPAAEDPRASEEERSPSRSSSRKGVVKHNRWRISAKQLAERKRARLVAAGKASPTALGKASPKRTAAVAAPAAPPFQRLQLPVKQEIDADEDMPATSAAGAAAPVAAAAATEPAPDVPKAQEGLRKEQQVPFSTHRSESPSSGNSITAAATSAYGH